MNKASIIAPRIPVIFLCAAMLIGVFGHDMWVPDEPRVTAISMEMAQSGNLVIPTLAGQPFLEKPPLYYAVAAGAVRLLSQWVDPVLAVRLTSWLWMMGVLWMVFLLVKELSDPSKAWWVTLMLAISPGFLTNSIWSRVDSALVFFVVAALVAFARAYLRDQWYWFPVAGICLAGGFLTKGPIGPVLTGIGWLPLFLVFRWIPRRGGEAVSLQIPQLLATGGLAFFLGGIWVYLLYHIGGSELFNTWFFKNQVGRLTGSSSRLGHIHSGSPFYYVIVLAMYTLPFLGLVLHSLKNSLQTMWKRKMPDPLLSVGTIWGLGTLILLSIPATKREIYMLPALPAFAILAVAGPAFLSREHSAWWSRIWIVVCTFLSLGMLVLPVFSGRIHLPPEAVNVLLHPGGWYWCSAAVVLAGLVILYGLLRTAPKPFRVAAATIMVYTTAMLYPFHVIDRAKELRTHVQAFARSVPQTRRAHLAGMDLSETMRGALVVYADWKLPSITTESRLGKILEGCDFEYNGLVYSSRSDVKMLPNVPFETVLKGPNGERQLFWIQGTTGAASYLQKKEKQ